MNLLERIQGLANEKNISIKQIERECGIGNGTIRKWGTQSPSIENVRKVANYLQVSLSYLVDGEESETGTISHQFTRGEEEIFSLVRHLSETDKIKVAGVIENYLSISHRHIVTGGHYVGDIGGTLKGSVNNQLRK